MPDSQATIEVTLDNLRTGAPARAPELPALLVAWARERPDLVGAVALVERELIFGRGGARPDDGSARAQLIRQRPDQVDSLPPIENPRVSRRSFDLAPAGEGMTVRAAGRLPLAVNGEAVAEATVRPGDTLRLGGELIFLVTRRPRLLPPLRSYPRDIGFAFGQPDPDGIVGESPAAWRLRDELAFAARSAAHVLVHGPSGSGKELAAQAIHRLSTRGARALVARNAATFPDGIIDAELFGNVKNYPNPGTPEREGLIGAADGTTLFLDEIGEIPPHLQAHLLRVLDARGEYQRLGEERARRADLRVVAATNRDPAELKHDFAARLTMRIRAPGLDERRDDLPLLVGQLARALAARHEDLRQGGPGGGPARLDAAPDLIERLLRHSFTRQVRELEQILWRAAAEGSGGTLRLTDGVRELLDGAAPRPAPAAAAVPEAPAEPDAEPTRDEIAAALARAGGSVTRAARELGLRNRFVLYRLLRKHGLSGGDRS